MTQIPPLKTPRRPGELRTDLVDAGLEILAGNGLAGLTLRACAARAGVSHAAPAHHFAGLPGLLTAIAARGFAIFTETMINSRDAAETNPQPNSRANPQAALVAICQGYLRFASQHPALFTLMFNHPYSLTDDPDYTANACAAQMVLIDACAPFKLVTPLPGSTAMMIWSLVHGLACLGQSGRIGPPGISLKDYDISDILPPLTLKE